MTNRQYSGAFFFFILGAAAQMGCGSSGDSSPGLTSGGATTTTTTAAGGATAGTLPSGSSSLGGTSQSTFVSVTPGGGTSMTSNTTIGTGGTENTGNCTVTATSSVSSKIGSVGIVEVTTNLASLDSATIEFGLDTNYGLTAPVDLNAAKYRTLLLGMKERKTYHFRVVAKSGSTQCSSPDYTITTTSKPNTFTKPTITTKNATALAGGYLVCEHYTNGSGVGSNGVSFILDKDGEYVWWYEPKIGDVTVSRMTYDGKSMWIAHGNVPSGTAKVVRVSMDGVTSEDFSTQFAGQNHDLIVLPDETVGFIAYGSNSCDDIKERSPSGTVKTIVNAGSVFGDGQPCHANAIKYSKEDDTYIVSELDHDAYFKVDRAGKVIWVLGGTVKNSFTGTGAKWDNQHNLHILENGNLLIFNNGAAAAGSKALELKLDLTAKTSTITWEYAPSPSIANNVMGDVQRLDNGNTLVVYSTQGKIHEVDASKALLQEFSWGLGAPLGYCEKRASLYGPPPR